MHPFAASQAEAWAHGNPPPPPHVCLFVVEDSDVLALVKGGKKVRAVKMYRERHGCSLKDAVDAVESMRPAPEGFVGDAELAGRVDALLHERRFLEAIRLHRQGSGCDLKDAKDAVERRTEELGIPAQFGFWAVLRGLWRR